MSKGDRIREADQFWAMILPMIQSGLTYEKISSEMNLKHPLAKGKWSNAKISHVALRHGVRKIDRGGRGAYAIKPLQKAEGDQPNKLDKIAAVYTSNLDDALKLKFIGVLASE